MRTTSSPTATVPPRRPSTHRARPRAVAVGVALVGALLLSSCWSANQTKVLDQVNAARKADGKAAVTGEAKAMAKAQAWSEHMARTGVLEHTGGGPRLDTSGLPSFCKLGENVGSGATTAQVHEAFLASGAHKPNIVGPYDVVGIGVARKGNLVYVTQIFLKTKGC